MSITTLLEQPLTPELCESVLLADAYQRMASLSEAEKLTLVTELTLKLSDIGKAADSEYIKRGINAVYNYIQMHDTGLVSEDLLQNLEISNEAAEIYRISIETPGEFTSLKERVESAFTPKEIFTPDEDLSDEGTSYGAAADRVKKSKTSKTPKVTKPAKASKEKPPAKPAGKSALILLVVFLAVAAVAAVVYFVVLPNLGADSGEEYLSATTVSTAGQLPLEPEPAPPEPDESESVLDALVPSGETELVVPTDVTTTAATTTKPDTTTAATPTTTTTKTAVTSTTAGEASYKTVTYDGGTYSGESAGGVPNGKGTLTYAVGDSFGRLSYDGAWKDGVFSGYGVLRWRDGSVYAGEFVGGYFDGHGKYTWNDGTAYDGDFVGGIREGKGAYFWNDGMVYTGDVVDGSPLGKGVYNWADGDSYKGDVVNGRLEGNGKYIWSDGTYWVGEWAANKRNGYGAEYNANGSVILSGFWESDVYQGE